MGNITPFGPGEEETRGIAIIGMAGKFPGGNSVAEFWEMLTRGEEGISRFSEDELTQAGVSPDTFRRPGYVAATANVADYDKFDAAFFGYGPREAEMIDPQHRLFLESAWGAMEDAGYDPLRGGRAIGVFAGCSLNTYLLNHLLPRMQDGETTLAGLQAGIASDKDFLATRVSYKLNLLGPSLTVQTACSTSLVAVHLAVQSLILGECDMALAGGSSIRADGRGYQYEEGSILSPDGRCRPFDEEAKGTVPGNGVGVVCLKRWEDAVRDRDPVYAIIRGTAVNNDGSHKIGYSAPSPTGQARVITEALGVAAVESESIAYVETHGTGTLLGDPIEIEALTIAHGAKAASFPCLLGSLKSNVGHMDAAAGVGGLIKTALALHHRKIPPTLHFRKGNRSIPFERTRFRVCDALTDWKEGMFPRRAGVSSFGIGGTNAHAILEEAQGHGFRPSTREKHLLVLSARTPEALDELSRDTARWLRKHPDADLADVAYTLSAGRHPWDVRRCLVGSSGVEIGNALESRDPKRVTTVTAEDRGTVFLFPGQGAQFPGMARGLYESENVFREAFDACENLLGITLRDAVFGDDAERLRQTALTQPALFTVEYAMAKQLESWGIVPDAMIGHSLGEYVAATLAGVFTLADALKVVSARGRFIGGLPPGAMISVTDADVALPPGVSIAAINTPTRVVLSGEKVAIAELEKRIPEARRLQTSHAFHSAMMEPAAARLMEILRTLRLDTPRRRFISNVSGTWITDAEATSPEYWAKHLLMPVRFADGVKTLVADGPKRFVEVGPGRTLRGFVKAMTDAPAFCTLPPGEETTLEAVGGLWASGANIDPASLYKGEFRARVHLPTYPFARTTHWIGKASTVAEPAPQVATPESEIIELVKAHWEESLGGCPDPDMDFYELGGDSMIATRIASTLKRDLGVSIPVSLFLKHTTIRAQADALESLLLKEASHG